MTTLYNCHTDGDQYRITKFDALGNVESTYLCTETECECPAGFRQTCRHRQMLPKFLAREAVNSFWFLDWGRQGWVMNEPTTSHDPMFKPAPPLPDGIQAYALNDLSPAQLHNIIAEAVGEPTVPAPEPFRRRV